MKDIKDKVNYMSLVESGMFWEFYPELTGDWEKDSLTINYVDEAFKNLQEEMAPYINTLVLDFFEVVRLVGALDGKYGYYYTYEGKNEEYNSSSVISYIPLKGNIKDEDYKELVRLWNLNNKNHAE